MTDIKELIKQQLTALNLLLPYSTDNCGMDNGTRSNADTQIRRREMLMDAVSFYVGDCRNAPFENSVQIVLDESLDPNDTFGDLGFDEPFKIYIPKDAVISLEK